MEGDVAGGKAGDAPMEGGGPCWRRYGFERAAAVGDPCWDRDTPKSAAVGDTCWGGKASEGLWAVKALSGSRGRRARSSEKGRGTWERQKEPIAHMPNLLLHLLPHQRNWVKLSVTCSKNKGN